MVGAVIGGLLGLLSMGPLGALLGGVAGYFFSQGVFSVRGDMDPRQRGEVERAFFDALFPVLGHLAKADGRVSPEEVESTEELIRRMGLSSAQRDEAIALFQKGKADDFDLESALRSFKAVCGRRTDFKRIYLSYLITLALADNSLHPEEERVLSQVADQLGFPRFVFNQLIGMVRAQMAFRDRQQSQSSGYSYYRQSHGYGGGEESSPNALALAYEALGASPQMSDAEIKKAYRRLMSENHPDKLAGQGVPEDMVKLATERSQEIQRAYDIVKKHRKA